MNSTKSLRTHGRQLAAYLVLALPALLAVAVAEESAYRDNLLTQSGFVIRAADTPERHAFLRGLPPDKLIKRVKDGKTYYIYADPNGCRCAYVGTPQAYATYRNGGPGMGGYNSVNGGGLSPGDRMLLSLDEYPVDDLPGDSDMGDFIYQP